MTELQTLSKEHKQEEIMRFGSAYLILTELLYKHDPIKLTEGGVPKDEYECEARMILRRLKESDSITVILDTVHRVFTEQFDSLAGDRDAYKEIAKDIYDKIQVLVGA